MAPVWTMVSIESDENMKYGNTDYKLGYGNIQFNFFQSDVSIDHRPVLEALQLLPQWLVSVLGLLWREQYIGPPL